MKALIFGIMLLTGWPSWPVDVSVSDTIQFSDIDYLNSLRGEIRSEDEGMAWGMGLELLTYQAKLNANDKSTRFVTSLDFTLPSRLIVGGGIQFGYSTLDKLSLAEGHVMAGYQFPKAMIRSSYTHFEYQQGASANYPSSGNVNEPDDFQTRLKGFGWEIRAELSPRIEGRVSWTKLTSDASFEHRSTGQSPTVFVSRRDGPLLSAIESVPNEWQIYELIFKLESRSLVSVQHSRSFSEYRSEWSLDTNALLKTPLREAMTAGVGLGEASFKSQFSRYAMVDFNYKF